MSKYDGLKRWKLVKAIQVQPMDTVKANDPLIELE